MAGCFQLREPEPATVASEWIQPTQVDILLNNFTTAVRTLNVANYERCFRAPGYRFVPDPTSAGSSQAIFANWSVPEETTYFTSLRRRTAPGSSNSLLLTDRRDNPYSIDSVEVSALYQLRINQRDTAFRASLLQGSLRLVLVRRRDNEWKIKEWRDQRTGTGACWTDLKRYFFTH
ncbi:hypothetical protein GCM10023185_19610 [Hymenobacter saemangeumensis]|uniref:SnoaL-like domain-containing protein n=2 Tax=Hymenobacter saemangeumensis TaxID=1084522 RepID=A0ABP8ICH1_9BACT